MTQFLPRHYPPQFGLRLVRIHGALVRGAHGKPSIPPEFRQQSAEALFDQYEWNSLWHEACMHEVIVYLKGSQALELPQGWADVIPKSLDPYK